MADQKVSDLPSLNGADVDAADLLYIIDSSAGSAGSKKITVGQYQLAPVSAGTANGVAYLNGSKVVTTGSGLVFDGTNLGIGTSSPAQRLDVTGVQNSVQARFGNVTGRGLEIGTALIAGTNDAGSVLNAKGATSGTLIFQTDSTEKMRLDSSGNLGLGVTPGTWAAAAKAIDFTFPAYGMDGNGAAFMSFNARNSTGSTWVYKSTDEAGKFTATTGGGFTWETAPSGTAGNAISFTQAMTLDANGNLGVGITSPDVRLRLDAASPTRGVIQTVRGTGSTGSQIHISQDGIADWAFGQPAGTDAFAFWSGRNRSTDGTERARITSGGVFCVNSSTNVGSEVALFKQTAGAGSPVTRTWNNSTSGDSEFVEFATEASYTTRGSITYNRGGGLVAYNTTSDYRAKDILGPVQNVGATIDALKVYEGRMKGATQSRPMLVAHEAQAVAPYAVSGVKDEVNEDGSPKFQQIDVSSLVPLLLAEIQTLRARVAALEQA